MTRTSMFALLVFLAAQPGWAAEKIDPEPAGQGRKALMKGTWELSSTMLRGRVVNFGGGMAGTRTLKFEKTQVVSDLPLLTTKPTWTLDGKKKPMTIDLTANGQTMKGLIKVEKDQLTLAINARGAARPTAFDNTVYLTFVMKRKAK